jgi:hypothetical protein
MQSSKHDNSSGKLTTVRLCFFTQVFHELLPREVRDMVYKDLLDDELQEQLAADIKRFLAFPKRSEFKPEAWVKRYVGYTQNMMDRGMLFPPVIAELVS